jgi:hypothetical protein
MNPPVCQSGDGDQDGTSVASRLMLSLRSHWLVFRFGEPHKGGIS